MSNTKIKYILVVANNKAEWNHFCETLEWKCSKQNTMYKRVQEAFHDIADNVRYSVFYNVYSMKERLDGRVFDDYVLLCSEKNVDMGLVLAYVKGE